jgi:hypothetical protein
MQLLFQDAMAGAARPDRAAMAPVLGAQGNHLLLASKVQLFLLKLTTKYNVSVT